NLLQRNEGQSNDFQPYVFLLAGGKPDDPLTTIRAASAVKDLQMPSGSPRLVSLSIGSGTDEPVMKAIASDEHLHIRLDEPQRIMRFFPAIGAIAGSATSGQRIEQALVNL